MYECESDIYKRINGLIIQSENYINLLYVTPCVYTKNIILCQLKANMGEINFLNNIVCNQISEVNSVPIELPQQNQQNQQNQREFTIDELSKYDGKNGNPAYIAVNGIVYDVTNNASWAAATHFGLTAGKDLTSEFNSCHAGQDILDKLKVVGKLR